MPTKRSGVRKSPRGASTPLTTPPGKSASPSAPASALGSSRKRKKTPGKSSGRKKVKRRLYPREDVDSDDQDVDDPATVPPGGEEPQEGPGYAPENPPSLVEQLEASDIRS